MAKVAVLLNNDLVVLFYCLAGPYILLSAKTWTERSGNCGLSLTWQLGICYWRDLRKIEKCNAACASARQTGKVIPSFLETCCFHHNLEFQFLTN